MRTEYSDLSFWLAAHRPYQRTRPCKAKSARMSRSSAADSPGLLWTYIVATEPLSAKHFAAIGWRNRQGVEDARNLLHYYRILPDNRLLVGGGPVGLSFGGNMNRDSSASAWQHLEEHMRLVFPALRDVKITHRWGGPFSVTLDLTPTLGYIGDRRAVYSLGCSGHGVSMTHYSRILFRNPQSETPARSQMSESAGKSEDFLLAEHKFFTDSFWRNEETGEKRVEFFITLATAVIGALVALATSQPNLPPEAIYAVIVFALAGLLGFGIVTLRRVIKRNTVTDEYKRAMDMVRAHFRNEDERLRDYQPFAKRGARKTGTGGLADVVALMNSLVVAALGVMGGLVLKQALLVVGAIALVGFVVAWRAQVWYVERKYEQAASARN